MEHPLEQEIDEILHQIGKNEQQQQSEPNTGQGTTIVYVVDEPPEEPEPPTVESTLTESNSNDNTAAEPEATPTPLSRRTNYVLVTVSLLCAAALLASLLFYVLPVWFAPVTITLLPDVES